MSITGLNPEKCQRRNRLAAKRDGINALPMHFLKSAVSIGAGATNALGTIPTSDEDALARINALRGEDMEPLALDQVWIHYAEAANSNFIPDRYAFLSTKTLKNIARDAQAGFAFMNSHKTGGLSHDSELPYGRTFAGRYEKMGDGSERALIGFYMLRGQYPNGRNGPCTDDLHIGIDGGTIFDVSVGLYGGEALCDVCGGDLNDWHDCDHLPGTDYNMTDEEMAAQKERGIADGKASYTIDDAHCGETSAVFDGAVPGAGFNKTLAFARQGKLSAQEIAQARHAYAPLLSKGDLPMDGITTAISNALAAVFQQFGLKPVSENTATPNKPDKKTALANKRARLQHNPAPISLEEEDDEQDPDDTTEEEPANTPAQGAQDPVLEAARKEGIDTPEKFANLLSEAADGRAFLSGEREKAKKLATVAFGNATEQARQDVATAHAFLDSAKLNQVQAFASQYKAIAVKLGLTTDEGTAPERKSASAELPKFAQDVATENAENAPKPVVLQPASVSFERRKRQVEEAAQGKRSA